MEAPEEENSKAAVIMLHSGTHIWVRTSSKAVVVTKPWEEVLEAGRGPMRMDGVLLTRFQLGVPLVPTCVIRRVSQSLCKLLVTLSSLQTCCMAVGLKQIEKS